jgi:hypothetical protein
LFELGVKLRGQRFIVRNNERGPIELLNDISDRERFARAGYTEQSLVAIPCFNGLDQLDSRLTLVAPRFVVRFELKRHPANLAQDRQGSPVPGTGIIFAGSGYWIILSAVWPYLATDDEGARLADLFHVYGRPLVIRTESLRKLKGYAGRP